MRMVDDRLVATGTGTGTGATLGGGGDAMMESQRYKLQKLHHAAYCRQEGVTPATCCTLNPHCCATKRLFEHVISCMDSNCDVPTCRPCRRIWRHYRKCNHVHACPLCSVIGATFASETLAPRFLKYAGGGGGGGGYHDQHAKETPRPSNANNANIATSTTTTTCLLSEVRSTAVLVDAESKRRRGGSSFSSRGMRGGKENADKSVEWSGSNLPQHQHQHQLDQEPYHQQSQYHQHHHHHHQPQPQLRSETRPPKTTASPALPPLTPPRHNWSRTGAPSSSSSKQQHQHQHEQGFATTITPDRALRRVLPSDASTSYSRASPQQQQQYRPPLSPHLSPRRPTWALY